jgi:hypothetical protein
MLKILRMPCISKPVLWFTIFSLLAMTNGCYYYRVNRSSGPPANTISKMQDEHKFIILHIDDKVWQLSDIIIEQENITGTISELYGIEKYRIVKPDVPNRYRKDQSQILNEVHIYTTEFTKTGSTKITFPIKAISRINIYDKATGATIASWGFTTLGIGIGAAGILLIIILLTKSSCPFIYSYNGTDYIFTGEIFSGATQPGLERDDYLLLPSVASMDGAYKVKITNEVHEIQSINFAGLVVIDHSKNNSVLIDKYGIPYSVNKPVSPVEAKCAGGNNVLPLIADRDSLFYSGNETKVGKNGIDEIVIKFIKPENAQSSKLIIRAKNSFWLDVLISKVHKLFGERYNSYSLKEAKSPGNKLRKWQLDQKIPLSVYIEKNGRWEFVDYFNIAGPMALRDDILPLNLEGINSDTIKIKLNTGFLFWDIDFAGMDFSKNEIMKPVTVPVKTAIDNNNVDISGSLLNPDQDYYVQKKTGDEAFLTFETLVQKESNRSVFLHTRGYYQILREQAGKADKKKLKTFRKPNSVPAFSKETFDLLHGR